MAIKTERPKLKVRTVRVVVIDADTGKSKSTTLYDTTPDKVLSMIEQAAAQAAVIEPAMKLARAVK